MNEPYNPTEQELLEFERRLQNEAVAEIQRLRDQLATARAAQTQLQDTVTAQEAEIKRLRAALVEIARNAPLQEPTQSNHPQNLPQAWSYWVSGNLAKRVLGQE